MAYIAKRTRTDGTTAYRAVIKFKGRVVATKVFDKKSYAQAWAKRIEDDRTRVAALGSQIGAARFTELCDLYIAHWKTLNRKDQTQPKRVEWWRARLGTIRVADITGDMVRNELDRYARGRKPATVNRHKACLGAIYKYAKLEQGLPAALNPSREVATRDEHNQRQRYLSEDERNRLLAVCRASPYPRLHLLVIMAITTGARMGELLKLRWTDIDFDRAQATLGDTKNGDPRVLPLTANVLAELRQFRGLGWVFPAAREPHKHTWARNYWDAAVAVAGIEEFRFHDLRHSCASMLVCNGATLFQVGEILGHRSTQTTKRYAHLDVAVKTALVNKVFGAL